MKIGIIGLGNLGSAVAHLVASNGHEVLGWEYEQELVEEINTRQINSRYLPGIQLPLTVSATSDVAAVFYFSELVFITLPSRFIASVLADYAAHAEENIPLVLMTKGIDADTGETSIQSLKKLFPGNSLAMVSGPSLANEFVRGVLTGLVAASDDEKLLEKIALSMGNSRFSVSHSDDVLGIELGGVLKNIYAMGLGIVENGTQSGLNFIGAYITQAMKEMLALGVAMGAKKESFLCLSGIGDLVATAMSENSHNRTMGRLINQGLSLNEIEKELGVLPEGYNTMCAALSLSRSKEIDLPLAFSLNELVNKKITLDEFYAQFTKIISK